MSTKFDARRNRFAAEAAALLGPDVHSISSSERARRLRPLLVKRFVRTYVTTVAGALVCVIVVGASGAPPLPAAISIGVLFAAAVLTSNFRTRAAIIRATRTPKSESDDVL
jgi:hypothetical protein